MTPQQLKERTFGALINQLEMMCAKEPALVVLEDLQWSDPTTLELLTRVVNLAPHLPLLLLVTTRPNYSPRWLSAPHVSQIELSQLGRSDAEALVNDLTGDKTLPAEVLDQIAIRTDGVPLFIEELTKSVLESGLLSESGSHYVLRRPLPPRSIPSTLHASLLARLDRLQSVKLVAQIGAAIGREFTFELIAEVVAMPEQQLRVALEQLTHAELVQQRGDFPKASFVFKHALVQEAAYSSLVRDRRKQLHSWIARGARDHRLACDNGQIRVARASLLRRG